MTPRPSSLTRSESREVDRLAIDELGYTGLVLMENAGRGCVDLLERHGIAGPVAVFCGPGNNGGDGLVMARHLLVRGYQPRVLLVSHADKLRGDALANYKLVEPLDVPLVSLAKKGGVAPVGEVLDGLVRDCDWLVDALLGTGAMGDPRPPYDTVIEWINACPAKTLAIDVPSGLDCDTGEAATPTVRADFTATFFSSKVGYDRPTAREYLGELHVLDIGIPALSIASRFER